MLDNKQEIIDFFMNKLNGLEDEQINDVELEIKITSNHGEVICYDSLSEENIALYVDVFEYAKVTEYHGTSDTEELGDYKPTHSAISGYALLIGDFGDYDGVTLTVVERTIPYFDFSF